MGTNQGCRRKRPVVTEETSIGLVLGSLEGKRKPWQLKTEQLQVRGIGN
jgi:hypothetical protein